MFVLKKIISSLLMPPVSLALLALLGLWLMRRHRRTGQALVLAGLLSLLVLSSPPVADALMRSLERYPAVRAPQLARVQAIVVLGGGTYAAAPEYGEDTLSRWSLERARYAAHLQRLSGLPLLTTGGAPEGAQAEAVLMKGVIEREFRGRVRWVEPEALDTAGNAERSARQLRAAGVQRIALVSHGWHLLRAVELFERQGLEVLPAPIGFRTAPPSTLYRVLPRASALADSSVALHEWLGLLRQRLG